MIVLLGRELFMPKFGSYIVYDIVLIVARSRIDTITAIWLVFLRCVIADVLGIVIRARLR